MQETKKTILINIVFNPTTKIGNEIVDVINLFCS